MNEEIVLKVLRRFKQEDISFDRIFSSMSSKPLDICLKVYEEFYHTNLGDPKLFKGTKRIEDIVIKIIGSWLGNREAYGFILSGGTEANFTAMWIARNIYKKKRANFVISELCHFSFDKISNILGLEIRKVPVNERNEMDINSVEDYIDENTISIVGIAGTTEYGSIDDIKELGKICEEYDLYLHVDAAFGGFVIPFLKELGYNVKDFDFRIKSVKSITIDPHKMLLVPIPAGGLILREKGLINNITFEAGYLLEGKSMTFLGTRSGASAAMTLASILYLGRKGIRRIVKECMEKTLYLYEKLKGIGMKVIEPTMNILVFTCNNIDRIYNHLLKRYAVSKTRRNEIRLVIMPHVTYEMIEDFLKYLKKIL